MDNKKRTFRIGPIRPPSEAESLLLQVTEGCTWNKCRFCSLYRHTKFKAYSADSIRKDIDNIRYWADRVEKHRLSRHGNGGSVFGAYEAYETSGGWDIPGMNRELQSLDDPEERNCYYTVANWLLAGGENVFLQDGNTTALSSGRLTDVLVYLRQAFPGIKRITSYGRAENLSRSSAEEFAELKEAGLDRIHSGYETGSDKVLQMINKGVTQAQQIKAGRAIKAGGIELSIYFMPGVGGKALSEENARGTAEVVNSVGPDFVRIRTAAVKQGTELYEDWKEGKFELCSEDDKVREIREIIRLAEPDSPTRIVSDHMVNLLQDIEGPLAEGKTLLEKVDEYLALPLEGRRLLQYLRRTLRAYNLRDLDNLSAGERESLEEALMKDSDRDWDIKMNNFICRYI
ncbi:MAG: radical SAM protein [Lentihominibacter sp.]